MIASSLRYQGPRTKTSRRFSPVSYLEHGLLESENLPKQDFYASDPNQKLSGDITYRDRPLGCESMLYMEMLAAVLYNPQ